MRRSRWVALSVLLRYNSASTSGWTVRRCLKTVLFLQMQPQIGHGIESCAGMLQECLEMSAATKSSQVEHQKQRFWCLRRSVLMGLRHHLHNGRPTWLGVMTMSLKSKINQRWNFIKLAQMRPLNLYSPNSVLKLAQMRPGDFFSLKMGKNLHKCGPVNSFY